MKRIFSILIACMLVLSCFSFTAFADHKDLLYYLTVDGKNEIYVEAGEEITVDLHLKNITDDGTYTVTNLQSELRYDKNFFEFTAGDVEFIGNKTNFSQPLTYSGGTTCVQVRGTPVSGGEATTFQNEELLARVTFKVKDGLADGASSIIDPWARSFVEDALAGGSYTVSKEGLTVHIGKKTDYVVEVGLDENDYVDDTKLVLVYTNENNTTFNYNGIPMFDVSGAGYEYEGAEDFKQTSDTKVFALVVEPLAANTLDAYKSMVTVGNGSATVIDYDELNDVNGNGTVNWDDIISVYAVAEHNETAFTKAMAVVIKADTNHDKVANIYDATSVLKAVYGG